MSEETSLMSDDATVVPQSLQDSFVAAESTPVVAQEVPALAVEPETLPTVFAEPQPEVVPIVEAAAADPKKTKGKNHRSVSSLVAGSEVRLSKVIFESKFNRNSASVRIVQTRLIELGYTDAGADRQGWVSEGTASALTEFAKDSGIEAHNIYTQDLLNALFEGTGAILLP